MRESNENQVVDPGLDETTARRTVDEIEAVVRHVLDKETAARLRVYLDTCVHCGLCAGACHTYLSRDADPRFSPVGKVRDTIWELVKRATVASTARSSATWRASPSPSAGFAGAAACTARSASTSPTCC